jgi:natural product biosynthesis luciferase-like monooxygenase protein
MSASPQRRGELEQGVRAVIESVSGRSLADADAGATFFDLGFDSLLMTQVGQALRQKFGVKISFRQLMESLVTIGAVADYLDEQLPADAPAPAPVITPKPVSSPVTSAAPTGTGFEKAAAIDRIVKQQFDLMNRQLELLRGVGISAPSLPERNGHASPSRPASPSTSTATPRAFGPYRPPERGATGGGLTAQQQEHLDQLIRDYVARTPRSKAYTQKHRTHFADPRTVAGFRSMWKEMVYPVVVRDSWESRFRDLDGNEYVDLTMGFGTNLFGHSPDFVTRAVVNQLGHGMEVGPQSPLAGKVASLLCELSGMERAAFCNTGSEAVLAAIRLARTVTGRTKIATTSGYHGINDEVLVRAAVVDGVRRPVPVAPGVPQHAVDEVLVLDYGTDESLELLRAHAHELAAVLIEPVQSRRPELQPVEFLRQVREITAASETALVFDELITGFRTHPGGAQAFFGIEADLATYGKIMGGGVPIGAICGKARFMDALDGGAWQYGDDSSPETGMTFFAGTYVRHPLALRAALSVLTRLKREGPALQDKLSERTDGLAGQLNALFETGRVPMRVNWFRSMMYLAAEPEFKYASLLYFHLRLRGLHIWEGRPFFLSTAHIDEEIDFIVGAFQESLVALREGGFIPETVASANAKPEIAVAPLPPAVEVRPSGKAMEFSLYFFGSYDAAYRDNKYALLQDAAKFADGRGFTAVWLPERHFHAVGGFSPNASLLACTLAPVTTHLQLRGGSVVLPLHHPVRVAEEWSVADNLSHGRVAISVATGWHPNDFVFAPDAFEDRRAIALQNLDVIRKLWRGETIEMPTPGGGSLPVQLHPLPKQRELPVWLTCIHRESYAEAGRQGFNVLGYLMNQTVAELAEKIAAYREGRRAAGLDPAGGHVTTLLFTYLDETVDRAREISRGPLGAYLRAYLDNSRKKIEQERGEVELAEEDLRYLTDRSCDDYFNGKSLIGTAESCAEVVRTLAQIGVDEIGCFVDFGLEPAQVMASLERVVPLLKTCTIPHDEVLSLPPAEQGLWLLGTMNEDAARAYRESVTLSLTGELDREVLTQALQAIVDRHGALRTVIDAEGRTQTVLARHELEPGFSDYSNLPPERAESEAKRELAELENGTFTGLRGPFLLAHLVKVDTARHFLVLVFHHVVGNGPSYWVILEELAALYAAGAEKKRPALPAPVPFSEFVKKRLDYETSPAREEAEQFWLQEMAQGVPGLDLPYDHPLPLELTWRGRREEIVLEPALTEALKKAGATHRCSLFNVLLAAYSALLHRLSGQDNLFIGVPFDSPLRSENPDRNLFANTTNMLPIRSRLDPESGFIDHLLATKARILASAEHQDYFFGHLIAKLRLPRNPARAPFFNVVFNLETGEFDRTAGGLRLRLETKDVPYRGPRRAAMFDLYLNAAERASGEILVQCDYNTALIEPATMQRWLGHYQALLRGIAADPTRPIADLPLTDEAGVPS